MPIVTDNYKFRKGEVYHLDDIYLVQGLGGGDWWEHIKDTQAAVDEGQSDIALDGITNESFSYLSSNLQDCLSALHYANVALLVACDDEPADDEHWKVQIMEK